MAVKRRGISPQRRFKVLNRYGFRCRYCGRGAPDVELHVDHYVPVAGGGCDETWNLMPACEDCNLGKGARHIEEFDPTLADVVTVIFEVLGHRDTVTYSALRALIEREAAEHPKLSAFVENMAGHLGGFDSDRSAREEAIERLTGANGGA